MKHTDTTQCTARRIVTIFVMTVLVLSLFMTGASAISKDLKTETNITTAGKASGIKIDGSLGESAWSKATWNSIAERQVATMLNNAAEFAVTWDNKNLYVGIKVTDASIVTTNLNDKINYNDGIEIYLDPNNEKASAYDDKTIHLLYQVADGKLAILGAESKDVTASYPNVIALHATTEDGYTVEAVFPFAELGMEKVVDGTVIGIEVNNNDDDNAASNADNDRFTLFWNTDTKESDPSTWGNVALYVKAKNLISYYGTPTIDGIIEESEGWVYSSEALNKGRNNNYKIASMCDDKNFYLAIELWGEDNEDSGMTLFFDKDNSKSKTSESRSHVTAYSFLNNHTDQNQPNSIIKAVRTKNGYTVEVQTSLEHLGYKPEYLDAIGVEIQMFAKMGDYTREVTWSGAGSGVWSGTIGYGSLIFNSVNVGGGNNTAPTGNQISSYSIAEGTGVSGKITVKDPDGDPLTYKLDPYNAPTPESKGTFILDEKTGEWTYTPPKNIKLANEIVNYYIQVADDKGATFHQRIELKIEYKPTNRVFHVDGDIGKDTNKGTEDKPFKSIYTAISMTRPGDTVIIHESDIPYGYTEQKEHVITTSGLPGAYITFKAAEGEQPVINCRDSWHYFRVQASYIIIDGLTFNGQGFEILKSDYEGAYDCYHTAVTGGGVARGGRYCSGAISAAHINNSDRIDPKGIDQYRTIHHLEFRNNLINGMAGGGISGLGCDYVTIENNTITNCCYFGLYGGSGISLLNGVDIDDHFDEYKFIIRNNITGGNRHFLPWISIKKFSDGNGIIVDSTDNTSTNKSLLDKGDKWGLQPFGGKTLVANNLSYLNGGSGIHIFNGDNCDMINNTVFANSQTPQLIWSDFFSNSADNINMINNIVYSGSKNPANISSSSSSNVFYDHNLFYNYLNENNIGKAIAGKNGNKGTVVGEHNIYKEDPLFVNVYEPDFKTDTPYPTTWDDGIRQNAIDGGYYIDADYDVNKLGYDFNLKAGSPALGTGDPEWSKKLGNDGNRMGIFGTIGSPLMAVTVSEDTPNTDIYRGDTPVTDTISVEEKTEESFRADNGESDKPSTDSGATEEIDEAPSDEDAQSLPFAIPIAAVTVIVVVIVIAVVLAKKKSTAK